MNSLSSSRSAKVLVAAVFVLLIASAWGYVSLSGAQDALASSTSELAAARQSASHIVRMRGHGEADFGPTTDVRRRINSAVASAALPEHSVASIDDQAVRRMAGTPYVERPTQVLLNGLALKQVITFLHEVTADSTSLRIGSIRLTVARDIIGRREPNMLGRWTAEVVLNSLVYAPEATTSSKVASPVDEDDQ